MGGGFKLDPSLYDADPSAVVWVLDGIKRFKAQYRGYEVSVSEWRPDRGQNFSWLAWRGEIHLGPCEAKGYATTEQLGREAVIAAVDALEAERAWPALLSLLSVFAQCQAFALAAEVRSLASVFVECAEDFDERAEAWLGRGTLANERVCRRTAAKLRALVAWDLGGEEFQQAALEAAASEAG